ncbi:hypothetical protein B0G69_8005 [Paraburkholderia sp. RAU2J]|uniref:hypothetical protein n=1 Tax=Paraburkholderia sp. RAU2J TaxID=1938810 RepID=UPI000EB1A420|nr:hypothetical protein [Paraburkholderia sp. RAU2J]RKT10576.1 hypothetical protein B0G69_8005 [Paraburkholderia sp. RAU2J]
MDLREIQALHAQYTAQPVIIDIASHTAAMPALPAPERGAKPRNRAVELVAGVRNVGKPTLIALAIAAVAATGGMSGARIWHAMHETVATSAVVAAPGAAKQASVSASEANADMPINFTPAHPLTSSDLDPSRPMVRSALSDVDTHALSAATSAPALERAGSVARPAEQSVAAASPIRVQRQSTPITPPPAAPPTPPSQPSQPLSMAAPIARGAQPAPAQPKAAVTAPAQDAAKVETRPALHPLHHVTRHAAASASNEGSPEPNPPAQPKAQPGKSGDVQLF